MIIQQEIHDVLKVLTACLYIVWDVDFESVFTSWVLSRQNKCKKVAHSLVSKQEKKKLNTPLCTLFELCRNQFNNVIKSKLLIVHEPFPYGKNEKETWTIRRFPKKMYLVFSL